MRRRQPVGHVGDADGEEAAWDEAEALHAHVSAHRQVGVDDDLGGAVGLERHDVAAVLVRRDQGAREPSERRRRHLDPALDHRPVFGDRRHPAPAVQGAGSCPAPAATLRAVTQEPAGEPTAGPVEGDAGQELEAGQVGERRRPPRACRPG